jgi:hypothetical protein
VLRSPHQTLYPESRHLNVRALLYVHHYTCKAPRLAFCPDQAHCSCVSKVLTLGSIESAFPNSRSQYTRQLVKFNEASCKGLQVSLSRSSAMRIGWNEAFPRIYAGPRPPVPWNTLPIDPADRSGKWETAKTWAPTMNRSSGYETKVDAMRDLYRRKPQGSYYLCAEELLDRDHGKIRALALS